VRSTTEAVPASGTLLDNIFSYDSASRDRLGAPPLGGAGPTASPAPTGSTVIASNSLTMTWLPPTKVNLALLAIDIPLGFSHATPPVVAIGVPMPGSN
jgi:hypothetical protein